MFFTYALLFINVFCSNLGVKKKKTNPCICKFSTQLDKILKIAHSLPRTVDYEYEHEDKDECLTNLYINKAPETNMTVICIACAAKILSYPCVENLIKTGENNEVSCFFKVYDDSRTIGKLGTKPRIYKNTINDYFQIQGYTRSGSFNKRDFSGGVSIIIDHVRIDDNNEENISILARWARNETENTEDIWFICNEDIFKKYKMNAAQNNYMNNSYNNYNLAALQNQVPRLVSDEILEKIAKECVDAFFIKKANKLLANNNLNYQIPVVDLENGIDSRVDDKNNANSDKSTLVPKLNTKNENTPIFSTNSNFDFQIPIAPVGENRQSINSQVDDKNIVNSDNSNPAPEPNINKKNIPAFKIAIAIVLGILALGCILFSVYYIRIYNEWRKKIFNNSSSNII